MRKIRSTYDHRGVRFTCDDDLQRDMKDQHGLDVLYLIERAIDELLMVSRSEYHTEPFDVEVQVTKDLTPTYVDYHFRVSRTTSAKIQSSSEPSE